MAALLVKLTDLAHQKADRQGAPLSLEGMRASSRPTTSSPGYGWLSEGWLPVARNARSAVAALLLLLLIAQISGGQGAPFSLEGMRASSRPITSGPGYGWLSEGWLPVARNTRSADAAAPLLPVMCH